MVDRIDVERGEHGDVGQPHAGDMRCVTGVVPSPMLVADRGCGEGEETDDGELVVLPRPHRGEHDGCAEHGADRAVVPASDPDVTRGAFAGESGGRASRDGGEPGEHVHGKEREEDRRGGADLGAEKPCGVNHVSLLPTG